MGALDVRDVPNRDCRGAIGRIPYRIEQKGTQQGAYYSVHQRRCVVDPDPVESASLCLNIDL
jgi:hypothetical protein